MFFIHGGGGPGDFEIFSCLSVGLAGLVIVCATRATIRKTHRLSTVKQLTPFSDHFSKDITKP